MFGRLSRGRCSPLRPYGRVSICIYHATIIPQTPRREILLIDKTLTGKSYYIGMMRWHDADYRQSDLNGWLVLEREYRPTIKEVTLR